MLESSRGDDVTYYANEATRRDAGGDVAFLITFSEGFGAQFYENEGRKPGDLLLRYMCAISPSSFSRISLNSTHEYHETCHSVTLVVVVNSHQR